MKKSYSSDNSSIQHTREAFEIGSSLYTSDEDSKSLYDTLYRASVEVKNTGKRSAKEVVQLYLSFPSGNSAAENQPAHVLRGFTKLSLAAGEAKTATFDLRRKDLSIWDTVAQRWVIPEGTFTLYASQHGATKWSKASQATISIS